MDKVKIPKCNEITASLAKLPSILVAFDSVLANREKSEALRLKKEIKEVKVGEFDVADPYDIDLISRFTFAERNGYLNVGSFNEFGFRVAERLHEKLLLNKEGHAVASRLIEIGDFSPEGLALISFAVAGEAEERYNFIGPDGKYLFHNSCKSALPFSDGIACIKNDIGGWIFIDKYGINVTDGKLNEKFMYVTGFSEGIVFVKKKNTYMPFSALNVNGEEVNKTVYVPGKFSEGLCGCRLEDDDEYYYVGHNFKPVLGPYKSTSEFHEGKAFVQNLDNTMCCIDKGGNELFFIEDAVMPYANMEFHDGMARIVNKESMYFVNEEGKKVIDLKDFGDHYSASCFHDGVTQIGSRDETMIVDKKGRILSREYEIDI